MRDNSKIILMALAAITVSACGGASEHYGTVQMKTPLPSTSTLGGKSVGVDSVVVTVYGPNGWGVTGPCTNSKADNTGEWSGLFDRIPLGGMSANFAFSAVAYGGGKQLFSGSANISVAANTVTTLVLVLQESNPPAIFTNHAPFIRSIFSSDTSIAQGATLTLTADAADADADPITILWTGQGTFDKATQLSTKWTPPAPDGKYSLLLTVADNRGATASAAIDVTLSASSGRGGMSVSFAMNLWPVVDGITANNSEGKVGTPIDLVGTAHDPDGSVSTWLWSSTCGAFSAGGAAITSFVPAAKGECKVTLVVTDGDGGSNSGDLTITVGDTKIAYGPQFYVKFMSPTTLFPGQSAEVQVIPADPWSNPTWSYSCSDGNLGTFAPLSVAGDYSYTPAACTSATPLTRTATVLVTDTTGGFNSVSMDVIVNCVK